MIVVKWEERPPGKRGCETARAAVKMARADLGLGVAEYARKPGKQKKVDLERTNLRICCK